MVAIPPKYHIYIVWLCDHDYIHTCHSVFTSILYMHVITLIYSKRYIRTCRQRFHIFNGLICLILIHLTVRKMEIDIPERDNQSKSPSDCSIDLCSILWFYCRLWFIVSDDERFWFWKNQYFILGSSHFHGGTFPSVIFCHIASQQTGYTVSVYFSNIIGKYCRW